MSSAPHPSGGLPQVDANLARRPSRVTLSSIAEAVRAQLRASPYFALRSLQCHAEGESLVLEGRVGSYYLKQLASAVAQRAGAGCLIDNRLEVVAGATVFWVEDEEPTIDPLSGRRRWQAAGAQAPQALVQVASQSA